MSKDINDSDESGQRPDLDWSGGVPVAVAFDDPYYSLENGLAETRHVFLGGNGLPGRFQEGFHIAELGFGTGLNCLTALCAWNRAGCDGPLRFTSFEAFPISLDDMSRAHAPFEELKSESEFLLGQLQDHPTGFQSESLILEVVVGDARDTLPKWSGAANAWFLDGFAPARNPELWEPELMAEVSRHTAVGGTAATYTAAGFVRRGLEAAGFHVERTAGFGRKRHMTKAWLP